MHEWCKNKNIESILDYLDDPDIEDDDMEALVREVDEHGRLPHHWLAGNAQYCTPALAGVFVTLVFLSPKALIIGDNAGETPLEIASRSRACAEIIGLLSLTFKEARSLSEEGMLRLYAPVAYWRDEMYIWIESRSYADCHKFINEHDDELVREVLKYSNSDLLRFVACNSQAYSDSLMFLALRMIHRHPLSLIATDKDGRKQHRLAGLFNACNEIVNVLRLTPNYISSTSFPTLLLHFLPIKHNEIYGTYNTACTFIKHMKYDKAELTEVEAVVEKPTRKCDVCKTATTKTCTRCKHTFYCSPSCQKSAWKKHKKTCKAPTSVPASEAELRILHEGMLLLNRCIQEPGAGDGPTSVVLDFLRVD